MSLSCSCDYDPEPGDVCWWGPNDFTMYESKRATKCRSCGDRVKLGDCVAKFDRYKVPEHEIELRIYGEDWDSGPKRAPHFLCERCAGLYFSLYELGFECIGPDEDMRELVKDYARDYGPEKESGRQA